LVVDAPDGQDSSNHRQRHALALFIVNERQPCMGETVSARIDRVIDTLVKDTLAGQTPTQFSDSQ